MDISEFLNIEKKYALYEKNINGVYYWNYSRVQIWNYKICAQKLKLKNNSQDKGRNCIWQMKVLLGLLRNCIGNEKISQVDILFVPHERRVKVDGVYQCIYTDCLAKVFSNSMILDRPYMFKHEKPVLDLKRYYGDYITLKGNIFFRQHRVLRSPHYIRTLNLVKKQMQEPLKDLLDAYHLPYSMVESFYDIMHKNFLLAECDLKLYDKLLEKIKPKIIVEVVYYGMHNMMLNELAKRHGIYTVELQHGTMHKDHAAYQINWNKTIPQLPDKIFLFSDFWKRMIRMPIDDDSLIVTGFPHFDLNMQKYHLGKEVKTGKTILFISQETIGRALSKFALEVANELLQKGYRLIYKLHPAEAVNWEINYPYLKNSGIEVENGQNKDVYECFSISDIQVGVYSTAIYEGLGFGLRTFIYNVGHADTMYELAEEGYAQIVNGSKEFIGLLGSNNVPMKGEKFWEKNSIEKMTNMLQKLLRMNTVE